MRVQIVAVGRLRSGPERVLIDDYLTRFDRTGRGLSLGPAQVIEVDDRKGGGMAAEARLLEKAIPAGALVCAMDERGQEMTSPDFAARIAAWRDGGRQDLALVIGGADGLDPTLRARGCRAQFWPHGLAAHAGAGDARRTALPRRFDPRRRTLSPGLRRGFPV